MILYMVNNHTVRMVENSLGAFPPFSQRKGLNPRAAALAWVVTSELPHPLLLIATAWCREVKTNNFTQKSYWQPQQNQSTSVMRAHCRMVYWASCDILHYFLFQNDLRLQPRAKQIRAILFQVRKTWLNVATFVLQRSYSHQVLVKKWTPGQDCGLCIWTQLKMKQLLILQ